MKKIFICSFIIMAASAMQVSAFDWNSALKFWEKASEAQAVTVQETKTLADIESQMNVIDKSVQDAFINIVSQLSTKKETKNIKSQISSNASNSAARERTSYSCCEEELDNG